MGSTNVFKKLALVSKLVLDGKRDPEEVSRVLQSIISNKKSAKAKVKPKRLSSSKSTKDRTLKGWQVFYKEVFGQEVDFEDITIPERKPGFDRLLVIAKGMTPQLLFDKCKELFPSWKYTKKDLDEFVVSDRTSQNGHYAVWVRDRQEADEENKNLSANDLKTRGVAGITLEERMLYEMKFFRETGKHLDLSNWTLCSGSRDSDGHVPCAGWGGGEFLVYWYDVDGRDGSWRGRSAVSLTAKQS